VTPEDYDRHMEGIGQAHACADLVTWFLSCARLPKRSRVVVVGAGTGWLLDRVDAAWLRDLSFTFTDISPRFLDKLKERLRDHGFDAEVLEDDIEATALSPRMDLLIASLVLEHIDWRKGVASIAGLSPRLVGVVLQENPPGMTTSITPGRTLPPSIEAASQVALSGLVPRLDVLREFERWQYRCETESVRSVADEKRLIGCLFRAAPEQSTN